MSGGIRSAALAAALGVLLCALPAAAVDISENSFEPSTGYFTSLSTGCQKKLVIGTNEEAVEIQCGSTGGPIVFPYVLPQDAGSTPTLQWYVTYGIDGICSGGTNNGGRCKVGGDCPSGSCTNQGSARCKAQMKMVCYPDGANLNAPTGSAQVYEQPLDFNPGPGKIWTQGGQQPSTAPFNARANTNCDGACRDTICQASISFISVSNQAQYCNLRLLRLQYNRQ